MSKTKQASKAELATEAAALRRRVKELKGEVKDLRREVAALEAEARAAHDALGTQEFSVRRGYVCTVYDAGDGCFIGGCPTLHAGSQGQTREEASAELDDAIEAVIETFCEWGRELPEPDAQTPCPGQGRSAA